MLGDIEGSAEQKLEQVRSVLDALLPGAECLIVDGSVVRLQLQLGSALHVQVVQLDPLPAELIRHATVDLARAAMPQAEFAEWQHRAAAWHLADVYGAGADTYLCEQIDLFQREGDRTGALAFQHLRRRVEEIQFGKTVRKNQLDL